MNFDDWVKQQIAWCRSSPFELRTTDGEKLQIFSVDEVTNVPDDCTFLRSMANGEIYAMRIVGG